MAFMTTLAKHLVGNGDQRGAVSFLAEADRLRRAPSWVAQNAGTVTPAKRLRAPQSS